MTVALGAALALAILLPHLLPLHRAAASTAAAVWMAALAARALTGIVLAILIVFYLPATGLFGLLTRWCWHAVIPFLATHLGFGGHALGDAAAIVPVLVIGASALSLTWGVFRAGRAVRKLLSNRALGTGPMGSVIVGGPDVVVVAAGLTRPRIMVSAGALVALDDAELAASLEHERGHIARRHGFVLLVGHLCQAVGALLPGGRRAVAELAFHLERDADAYALARDHDRCDLTSAIGKAAVRRRAPAVTPLTDRRSGTGRLALLAVSPARPRPVLDRMLRLMVAVSVGAALALAAAVPSLAASGVRALNHAAAAPSCQS